MAAGLAVPAGTSGTIHLTYRFDSLYRWSLLLGLILVALLLVAACLPTPHCRRPRRDRFRRTPFGVTVAAAAGDVGDGVAVVRVVGLAVGVVVGAIAVVPRPRTVVGGHLCRHDASC